MSYRLSPNEEALVLQRERERRRKLRIQQVREQERHFARRVRNDVRQRKTVELKVLAEQLKDNWVKEKQEKQEVLKKVYEKNLKSIGEGHRAAAKQEPQDDIRALLALRNKRAAKQRHNVALDKLRDEQDEQKQKEYEHILSRVTALEIEKARAAKIASLPPPLKEAETGVKASHSVKCVEDFSTTHYHATNAEFVEKAEPHEQGDARAAAQEEEDRLKDEKLSTQREQNERKEKALLRHKHAHKRALLEQDMDRLMGELDHLEQADRRRRQAIVAKIPNQVFQPPHRRLEEREEQQQNLEQVFEDMYMANTEFTGDLTLALEPRVPVEDQDLDLTTESTTEEQEITLQRPSALPQGTSLDAVATQEDRSGIVGENGVKPPSRSETLKKIMSRIHNQQQEWRDKSAARDVSTQHKHVTRLSKVEDELSTTPSTESSTTPAAENTTTTLTSSTSSDAKSSSLSEHPIVATDNDNRSTPTESLEGGSLSDVVRSEPIISGSDGALMHPMEHAAKIRSKKMPDIQQQRREIQQLLHKEEEQRQQFARQQIDSHKGQRHHLQTLQRNLLERQQALDMQIRQQSGEQKQAWQQIDSHIDKPNLQTQQQILLDRQNALALQITQQSVGQKQGLAQQQLDSNTEKLHRERAMPKEHPMSQRHLEQSGHIGRSVSQDQQNTLPLQTALHHNQLMQQELPVVQQEDRPMQVTHQSSHNTTVTAPVSQNTPILNTHVFQETPVNQITPVSQSHHATTSSLAAQQQRIHEYQLHLLNKRRQSQNALQEAQARLQQRRVNLLQQYPEMSLADYTPYQPRSVDAGSNVIFSQAEKELGPVMISSDQYRTSNQFNNSLDHSKGSDQYKPIDPNRSGNQSRMDDQKRADILSLQRSHWEKQPQSPGDDSISTAKRLDGPPLSGLANKPAPSHSAAPDTTLASITTGQGGQYRIQQSVLQELPGGMTPSYHQVEHFTEHGGPPPSEHANKPASSHSGAHNTSHAATDHGGHLTMQQSTQPALPVEMTLSQTLEASLNAVHQTEQSLRHGGEAGSNSSAAVSDDQAAFREFLKHQREKLEQQNKEHHDRIKEKQQQLRDEVQRQMNQYMSANCSAEHLNAAVRPISEPSFVSDPQTYTNASTIPIKDGRLHNITPQTHHQRQSVTQSSGDSSVRPFPTTFTTSSIGDPSQQLRIVHSAEYPQPEHELIISPDKTLKQPASDEYQPGQDKKTHPHHPPPPTPWALSAQQEGIQPHELSTIIEVDTPQTERKAMLSSTAAAQASLSSQPDALSTLPRPGQQPRQLHLEFDAIGEQMDNSSVYRSLVENDNGRIQDLLHKAQRDMSRLLDTPASHGISSELDESEMKHPSLSSGGVAVPSPHNQVGSSSRKSPASILEQYDESLRQDFGSMTLPGNETLTGQSPIYNQAIKSPQHRRISTGVVSDGIYVEPSHHIESNKTLGLIPKQKVAGVGSEVAAFPTAIEISRTQSGISGSPIGARMQSEQNAPVLQSFSEYPRTHAIRQVLVSGIQQDDTTAPTKKAASDLYLHEGAVSRSKIQQDESIIQDYPMYADDVGRGVMSYPISKLLPHQTLSTTSTAFDPTSAPMLHPASTTQHTNPSSQPISTDPVIEIFKPTVDNSPSSSSLPHESTAVEDSYDTPSTDNGMSQWTTPNSNDRGGLKRRSDPFLVEGVLNFGEDSFAPMQRRSFGSGLSASNSEDTPSTDNGLIQWTTPKSNDRGGLRRRDDPFLVEGVMDFGFQQLAAQSFGNDSMSPSAQRNIDKDDENEQNQKMSSSVRWKDLLTTNEADLSLANQSKQSLLSEHPLSSGLNQTELESSSHNPVGTSLNQTGLSQQSMDSNILQQQTISPETSNSFQIPRFSKLHPSSSSSPSDSDSPPLTQDRKHFHSSASQQQQQHRGNLSSHSLDPTYSGFLPYHTSSQLTDDTADVTSGHVLPQGSSFPISHSFAENSGQEFIPMLHHHSYPPPSDDDSSPNGRSKAMTSGGTPGEQTVAHSGPSTSRYSGHESYADLSQHSIDLEHGHPMGANIDSSLVFRQPHPDPSKDSLSSIEGARSQSDQEHFDKAAVMPLFSDVSISQRSMSFESEQGRRSSGQDGRSSETKTPTFSVSDRYSLPGFHGDDNVTDQSKHSIDWPPAVPQSWQFAGSEFMGQSLLHSGEFQPLHEMTSSTLPKDEHTGSVETGIMEEPDLTLVSLNTTQNSVMADNTQPSEEPLEGGNLSDMPSCVFDKENMDPATDTSESSTFSLQEAFARRKAGFIQASEMRQRDVKVRAKDQSSTAISTTVANKKTSKEFKTTAIKSVSMLNGKNPRSIQPDRMEHHQEPSKKPNVSSSMASKSKKPKTKMTTKDDRKAAEKEMKQRTMRLYNKLDEVKTKRVEDERKEQYTANRQKRKEFEQKLQKRLSKWAKHETDK